MTYSNIKKKQSSNATTRAKNKSSRDFFESYEILMDQNRNKSDFIGIVLGESSTGKKNYRETFKEGKYKSVRQDIAPKLIDQFTAGGQNSGKMSGHYYEVYVRFPEIDGMSYVDSELGDDGFPVASDYDSFTDRVFNPINYGYGNDNYWMQVRKHQKALVLKESWAGFLRSPPAHGSVYRFTFEKGGPTTGETLSAVSVEKVADYSEYWYPYKRDYAVILKDSIKDPNVLNKPKHREKDPTNQDEEFKGNSPICVNGKISYEGSVDNANDPIDTTVNQQRKDELAARLARGGQITPADMQPGGALEFIDFDKFQETMWDLESAGAGLYLNGAGSMNPAGASKDNPWGMMGAYQFDPTTLAGLDYLDVSGYTNVNGTTGLTAIYEDMVDMGYARLAKRKNGTTYYTWTRGNKKKFYMTRTNKMFYHTDWTQGSDPSTQFAAKDRGIAATLETLGQNNHLPGSYTEAYAVVMKQHWLSSEAVQDAAFSDLMVENLNYMVKNGLVDLSNPADVQGKLAYAHLLGVGKLKKWVRDNIDSQDGTGTPGSWYYAQVSYNKAAADGCP